MSGYALHPKAFADLDDPDEVRRSARLARLANARLFSRCFDDITEGKQVVVVVVSEAAAHRHWVITA